MSVHEGGPAPASTRAMSPVLEALRSLPAEDALPAVEAVPVEEAIPIEDLFAALAARGAALVARQHAVLETLQNREEDPQRLAGLFSLDHLAAQLRRNSNAALALAGLPTTRSIHVPTVLSELAYAAVSEVNGFQRVSVGAFPTRPVQAHAASDLVHLLGDLLENALAVSPRSGGVWVRGERGQSYGGSGFAVRVGDSGAGLSDAALDQLNDMLAGRAPHNATGRADAFLVTREIVRRHGLTVQFERLVNGGMVATVALPETLFEPTHSDASTFSQAADRIA